MRLITLKEYAEEHNISYEAVRRTVVRYKKELDGHIITEKGSKRQFLDEEAQRILSDHRRQNHVTVIRENHSDQLKQKDAEIETLQKRVDFYRDELLDLQRQHLALIEEKGKYEAVLADHDRMKEEVAQARSAAETARAEAAEAKANLDRSRTEAETAKADLDRIRAEATETRSDLDRIRTEAEAAKADLEKIRTELQAAQQAQAEAEAEAASYTKSFFGFYRRKK